MMRKNKIDKPNLPIEGQATTKTDINVPLQSNISIEEAFKCEKNAVSHAIDFKIITLLEDKTFSFSNAKFNSSMQINGTEHTYSRTAEYKDKIYYKCINRNRKENTGKKCLAKVQYILKTQIIEIIDLLICTSCSAALHKY